MSQSRIPDLRTLGRGSARGRGRRDAETQIACKSRDEIIQNTDDDAAISRLSAVDAGYLTDPFAKLLAVDNVQRRLPLMNRGTYVRTTGIDSVVDAFLASLTGRKQIVSLGAGSDTRYFRLKRTRNDIDLLYHEVDFEANTKVKIERIQRPDFTDLVRDVCSMNLTDSLIEKGNLTSQDYQIHALDLRQLAQPLAWLDTTLPTLLLSECCLIYLSPHEADHVLRFFGDQFSQTPLAVAVYEPIRPDDSFGQTMVRNLVSRGIYLQTLEKYAQLPDQRTRLADLGLRGEAADIDFIWRMWIDDEEKERINHLEWMDEVEEFVLLAKHYCISWGWKNWQDDTTWNRLPPPRY